MHLTPLEWEQRRHLDEVRDLWRTLGPLLQKRHQFAGGVTWKQVKGYEYLARFQTDPITHSKKFEYLGKRKLETERIYADFQRERANLDGQIDALQRRMDVAARVGKALRIGRMPTQAADALRTIWRAGLDKDVVVVGSLNIYAYEMLTGLLVPREAAPGEDLDLMLLVPRSDEAADDLKRVLVMADRSYRFNSQSSEFIASDGFRISLKGKDEIEDELTSVRRRRTRPGGSRLGAGGAGGLGDGTRARWAAGCRLVPRSTCLLGLYVQRGPHGRRAFVAGGASD